MSYSIQALREMRDKIDDQFLRHVDSLSSLPRSEAVPDHHYHRLANLALIGGRLDKMIREEIAQDRRRRVQETRRI